MAKLLSYFNLCPIMDPKDFLGVADDKEEDTIINTLGRNIIIVIKLNSQKQIKSWNSIDKLHTKVVYDRASDRYVGGFGNNYLKCWNESTEDLKKVKRIKTAKAIQDILSVGGSTVIVFTDGSCSSLESIVDNIQHPENYVWTGPLSKKEGKVVKVEAHPDGLGSTFLSILVSNEDNEHSLFYYKIPTVEENSVLAPNVGVIRLKRSNMKCLNSCIVQGNSGLMILSIWSDKRIMRQDLRVDVNESDVGQFMEMVNFVKLDESFSIVSPAKNYIAVYGGNVQQEGSSLMLYNIQYNLIEAKQQFKVLFNNSRLWALGSNILLATGQSLSVIPFYIAEEQLLHIIGTKKDVKDRHAIQNDMIDEANDEQNLIEFQKSIDVATITPEEREKPLVCREFDEIVDSFLANPTIGLFEQDRETTTLVINEDPQQGLSITIRSLIKAMEIGGFSEMEITNELIPNLISHTATSDLMTILQKYSTFAESMIVECLYWGIKEDNKTLLARVLSIDFEEEYMIYNLRKKLSIEDVQYLVQLLHDCLSGECPCPDVDDMDLCEVIMKWFMCLIDAHYTNILMSKSKRMTEALKKWAELIEKHIEELQHLSSFSGLVERMARAKPIAENVGGSSKWYSITVVDLE